MATKELKLKQWRLAIDQTKNVMAKVDMHQLLIAEIALGVCEISHGGNVKTGLSERYTVRRFAKEAGLNDRTLSNWIGVRRLVFDRLTKYQQDSAQFSDLVFISRKVKRDTPRAQVQKVYADHMACDTFERKIIVYMQDLRSLHYNFEKHAAAFRLSDESLKEILFYCRKIAHAIKKDRPMVAPQITGVIVRTRASAAKAVLGDRVKRHDPVRTT